MMQRALSSCAKASRAIRAVSSSGRRVAVIYGSFCKHRESQTDADVIARALAAEGLEVSEPVEGVAGAWESAARADALVVCTSTRLGLPPENLAPFADALVGAAGDGAAPLGHLRHFLVTGGGVLGLVLLDRFYEEGGCQGHMWWANGKLFGRFEPPRIRAS